jgi:two-component system sensor histidine kinase RegB
VRAVGIFGVCYGAPVARASLIPERNWVNIQWLARLRWAEIAGQAVTVFIAQFLLGGTLPMAPLLAVIAIGLLSNVAIEMYYFGDRRRGSATPRTVHEWQVALVMMLDIALLTGLLYLSGGPQNPFSFLYLVQIALAAVLVRALWTWMLVGLSFVGFGILLVSHQPLAIPVESHVIGEWVALGVASAFVVHFLLRITGALAERERELTEARGLAARQERLASLATMAAGAAHELSTPLGTVALAAKELERALMKNDAGDLAADARLIREQVGRCRAILEQMAQGAGTVGESVSPCTVAELLEETMVGIRAEPNVLREIAEDVLPSSLRLPPRAVSQALRSLVTNAQDASPAHAVVLTARREDDVLVVVIRDRGPGISNEVMARIGEPFFTTKAPGRGMGLGLFLARAVIEGVGGTLQIDSARDGGTEVVVRLPTDAAARTATGPQVVARSAESTTPQVVSKPA